MKTILAVVLLLSVSAFAREFGDISRPSARDEYEGRLRVEQEQQRRQYEAEQSRRQQEEYNNQMRQQYPGYQGVPYNVRRGY